jgi:predicted MFS family arabinose efflux permease
MGFQLGSGVGAVVYGFVIQYLGYHTMYQLSLIPVMAALITVLLVWHNQSRSGRRSSGGAASA